MRHFKNPPKEYRPAPFWAWNDELDPKELAWQVAEMAQQGYGGYFMHSRVGLATRYLGPDWMRCVAACIAAGKRHDMQSWLYDEDKWPSGSAGGLVTRDHPERAAKFLAEDRRPRDGIEYLAAFDWDELRRRYRRLASGERATHAYLGYRMDRGTNLEGANPEQGTNNGQPYPDLLDPDVVETFLRITYDAYAKRFRRDFGEFVPGIFTDEPHIWRHGAAPWTKRLPVAFRELCGYDLLDRLPDLHHDTSTAMRTRHDFWRTVARLFRESFSRRLYERCERFGLALTGHYLGETPLQSQARTAGAVMPLYALEHMPGIDHLCRRNGVTIHMKQVASVAAQTGRRRVMCEMFGCSGHSMTFEDQKWLLDLHFSNGINFVNPHLTLYSMKGDNKRDYPPTFSYHQPYWKDLGATNGYAARCCVALSAGEPYADLLVLHPCSSVWCYMKSRRDETSSAADALDAQLTRLTGHLGAIQRDYHFADETILQECAAVLGATLRVGRMIYRGVIVPPSLTWRAGTVDLLRRFRGPILFVGKLPTRVDAEKSDVWKSVLARKNVRHVPLGKQTLERALKAALPPDVVIDAADGERSSLRIHQRRVGRTRVLFIANLHRKRAVSGRMTLAGKGTAVELDPVTGEERLLESRVAQGRTALALDLPPVGSRIIELHPGRHRSAPATRVREVRRTLVHGPFAFECTHPNVVTLDYARLRVGRARFSARLPVYRVRNRVREHFGVPATLDVQPWVLADTGFHVNRRGDVSLRYAFHMTDVPSAVALAMECPGRWRIRVNGLPVRLSGNDWFVDKQFGRMDITRHVRREENVIEVTARYDWDLPIENAYLLGAFGVRMTGRGERLTIVKERKTLRAGDWGTQGLPFYSGNVVYRKEICVDPEPDARTFVKLRFEGTLARVRVNGVSCAPVLFAPWETEITKALREGANALEIEIVSSLRNMMGPLHNRLNRDLEWTGPAEFVDEAHWTDVYQFEPCGLAGPIRIITRKTIGA